MAVTITIKEKNRQYADQSYVLFHKEISEYLAKLAFKRLKKLSLIDPYEEVTLEKNLLDGLNTDLRALLVAIRDQSIAEPPAVVGLEEDEEQFGWKGLTSFADVFLKLIGDAEKTGTQIIWIGV